MEMENTPYTHPTPTTHTYPRTLHNAIYFGSIGTWRWRWSIHKTPTTHHHPTPNAPLHKQRWVSPFHAFQYEHGEGDGEHTLHTTTPTPWTLHTIISFTTQPLTQNFIRKGGFHFFMHFKENTPFIPPPPTTPTHLNTSHHNFFHHPTPNTQLHKK